MAFSADLFKLAVTMQVKSGLPQDAVTFDLHYISDPIPDFDAMAGHIDDFLNTPATGQTYGVSRLLSNVLSTAAGDVEVAFYRIPAGGGASGPPEAVRSLTLGYVGADSLPEEAAACLSWSGDLTGIPEFSGSTRPRARRRNRCYLGPLNQSVLDQDTVTKRTKVEAGYIALVMASAIQYLYTEPFADSWLWRVVSRTAIADYPTFSVQMDDAFDTQRRRGPAPTARATAPVV